MESHGKIMEFHFQGFVETLKILCQLSKLRSLAKGVQKVPKRGAKLRSFWTKNMIIYLKRKTSELPYLHDMGHAVNNFT